MENSREKSQLKKSHNEATALSVEHYGYSIPLSDHRDAGLVLPQVFTPEEAKQIIVQIKALVEGEPSEASKQECAEDGCGDCYFPIHTFLTGINILHIGTEYETKRIPHFMKLDSGKTSYISLPEAITKKEADQIMSEVSTLLIAEPQE